jgi:hypothetical protein
MAAKMLAWEGLLLIAYGVFVIGLVDNVGCPVLVGKDTKMPDYVMLGSTPGGIAILGFNGFVIGPIIAAISSPPGYRCCLDGAAIMRLGVARSAPSTRRGSARPRRRCPAAAA